MKTLVLANHQAAVDKSTVVALLVHHLAPSSIETLSAHLAANPVGAEVRP